MLGARVFAAAALAVAFAPGLAIAQQPLKTAVDGTFAPHAMPNWKAASRASTSTSPTRSASA